MLHSLGTYWLLHFLPIQKLFSQFEFYWLLQWVCTFNNRTFSLTSWFQLNNDLNYTEKGNQYTNLGQENFSMILLRCKYSYICLSLLCTNKLHHILCIVLHYILISDSIIFWLFFLAYITSLCFCRLFSF